MMMLLDHILTGVNEMKRYTVKTRYKKSVYSYDYYHNADLGISLTNEEMFRWGEATITPNEDELADLMRATDEELWEDTDITAFEDYDIEELDDQCSGFLEDVSYPEDLTVAQIIAYIDNESLAEQAQEIADDNECEDVGELLQLLYEEMGWDFFEMLFMEPDDYSIEFQGPLTVEEIVDGEQNT